MAEEDIDIWEPEEDLRTEGESVEEDPDQSSALFESDVSMGDEEGTTEEERMADIGMETNFVWNQHAPMPRIIEEDHTPSSSVSSGEEEGIGFEAEGDASQGIQWDSGTSRFQEGERAFSTTEETSKRESPPIPEPDVYQRKVGRIIKEIKEMISYMDTEGMVLPSTPVNTYIKRITEAMQEEHFLEATKTGRECLTYLEGRRSQFEDAREVIIKLQEKIYWMEKTKFSSKIVQNKFDEVILLFKRGEYEKAREGAKECIILLEEKKGLYGKADKAIKEAWDLMKNVASYGWEMKKARHLHEEARKALNEEDYEESLRKADLAQEVVRGHFESLKGVWLKIKEVGEKATKAHEDSLSDIQGRLENIGEKIDEVLMEGIKIPPDLDEELTNVEEALAAKDVYEANRLIAIIEKKIQKIKEGQERGRLKLERAKLRLEETKRSTKDIRPMNYLFSLMEESIKYGNNKLVTKLSDRVQELCDMRERGDTLLSSLRNIENAGRLKEECKEFGMDVIDVNPLLKDSTTSFRKRNYQRALSKSELAYKILLEAKVRYLVLSTQKLIVKLEDEIAFNKEELLTELGDIEWVLDRGEPESAMERLRKIRNSLFEKKFLDRLEIAEEKIEWLNTVNIDLENRRLVKLIARSKLSYQENDFRVATTIIDKAIDEIEYIEQYANVYKERKTTLDILEQLEDKDWNVDKVKNKMEALDPEIESCLDDGNFVKAMKLVKEYKQMATDLRAGYDLNRRLAKLEKKITNLEMDGLSAPTLWHVLKNAYLALADGEIKKARSIKNSLEDRIKEEVKSFKKNKLSRLRELKKRAVNCFRGEDYEGALKYFNRAIKITPNNEKLHYNKAVVLSKLDREIEAIQYCSRALALNEDYEQPKRLRAKCRANLSESVKARGRYVEPKRAYDYAPLKYTPEEDVGLNVQSIENIISEIVTNLKEEGKMKEGSPDFGLEEYDEELPIREQINPLLKLMAEDLLHDTKLLIERRKDDICEFKEDIIKELKKIEYLLEKGNLEIIMKELQKIRLQLFDEPGNDAVLSRWKKILETRERGFEEEGEEKTFSFDIVDRTRPSYHEGDLREAIELVENELKECDMDDSEKVIKRERIEEILDKLKELRDVLTDLKDAGMSSISFEKDLIFIKPAIEKKFFQRAMDHVQKAYDKASGLRKQYENNDLRKEAEELIGEMERDLSKPEDEGVKEFEVIREEKYTF